MRNVNVLKKGQWQTMIFRKRKKAPTVQYNCDPRFTTEADAPQKIDPISIAKNESKTIFEAWTTYPAMKSCDMIRKLPSHCADILTEDPKVEELEKTTKNAARFNLELWKDRKKNIKKNKGESTLSFALQAILKNPMSNRIKTLRQCPPIKDLLTQTLVIKCPVDMHFAKDTIRNMYEDILPIHENIADDISWHWTSPAQHLHSKVDPFGEWHPKEQFCHSEGSQIEGYSNLKINTGIHLDMPDYVTAVQHQPIFHNIKLPMTVIPGQFIYPLNKCSSIIPNFFIRDDQEDFILRKGDALVYITFSESVKFEPNEEGSDMLVKFAFDQPQLSWRNLAKKLKY